MHLRIVVGLIIFIAGYVGQESSCMFGSCRAEGRIYPTVLDYQSDDLSGNSSIESSSKEYRKFDVLFDFTLSGVLDSNMKIFLTTFLLDPIAAKLEKMIKVSGPNKIPKITENGCIEQSKVPERFRKGSTSGDLLIFVAAQEFQAEFVAYAAACALSKIDSRPVVGLVTINTKFLKLQYSQIESLRSVILHEIFHILAFDVALYDKFPIGASRTYVKESVSTLSGTYDDVYLIRLPGLLEYAQKHFKCPTIRGIYMENEGGQGSAGSHFERRWVGNELMTSESSGRMVMSKFTLHFLNDVGWYKINFAFAEENPWGRNAGCEFFQPSCDAKQVPNFCTTPSRTGCSVDRMSKTQCVKSRFTDKCFLSLPLDTYDCTNNYIFAKTAAFERPAVNSRCLDMTEDSIPSTGCYPVTCETANQLRITIDDQNFYCAAPGQKISYKQIVVHCPSYSEICVRPRCTNSCYGNGICLANGNCLCNTFFRGKLCRLSKRCICNYVLCSLIQPVLQNFDEQEDIGRFIAASGEYGGGQSPPDFEVINTNIFNQTEFDVFDRHDKEYDNPSFFSKTAGKIAISLGIAILFFLN